MPKDKVIADLSSRYLAFGGLCAGLGIGPSRWGLLWDEVAHTTPYPQDMDDVTSLATRLIVIAHKKGWI